MTTNSSFPPPWITHLLGTKFYEVCTEADHQRKRVTTFFCKDCENNNAFCKNCKNNSNKHGGHEIVQVVKAPEYAVKIKCLSSFEFDVSDIFSKICHGEEVVFLHSRQKELQAIDGHDVNTCQICRYQLNRARNRDSIKFCSIKCKVTSTTNSRGASTSTTRAPISGVELIQSYRKRSRKGIPIRSPLN